MPIENPSRFSVSSYSLHRTLGAMYRDQPGDDGSRPCVRPQGALTLLELPAALAAHGYTTLEISHPHLPSREASYLHELRAAIAQADVHLLSVLVEAGDLTDPLRGERDRKWMEGWIETASLLGAERARLIAGHAPYSPETFQRSHDALHTLACHGRDQGVRVTTENWFDLLATPEAVCALLDSLDGEVGFNLDFGNWEGPSKYADLAIVFPYAETCHAKCAFPVEYIPDAEDYMRCLGLAQTSGFSGPYTLIYDASGADEWKGLAIERDLVRPSLA
jgi:hypothetical protein